MKVRLPEHLFSPEVRKRSALLLISLFEVSQRREHELRLTFDPEDSPLFAAWRSSLSREQAENVELSLQGSLQAEAREIVSSEVIATDQDTDWTAAPPNVGLEDLLDLLNAPMEILVEHELNDGAFLKAMGFGADRDIFLRLLGRGLIRFNNGGGSTMKALISARGQEPARAFRSWAIFDSDALVPERHSKEAMAKVKACNEARIQHHRLARRAIENYLPPESIEQRAPHNHKDHRQRKAAKAFSRLSPEQRKHFNLKEGFDGDRARLAPGGKDAVVSTAVQALYASVPSTDQASLSEGFGTGIARLFEDGISEVSRRKDGQEAEMIPLFRAILRWL